MSKTDFTTVSPSKPPIIQKWYTSYKGYVSSILFNEDIIHTNIIIARLYITKLLDKSVNTSYKFTKFHTTSEFVKYFQCCKDEDKNLYVVLRNNIRYLYIDVDYKTLHKIHQSRQNELISIIMYTLNNYINNNASIYKKYKWRDNWYIWSATRKHKFSLHCINISIILPTHQIQQIIQNVNKILHDRNDFPTTCKLDDKVYKQHYQLWRLPMCYKDGKESEFKLITPKKIDITRQFKINFMNFRSNKYINFFKINVSPSLKKKPNIAHSLNVQKDYPTSLIDIHNNNITKQIYNMFNITTLKKRDRHGFILKNHICPIKKGSHRSNTGRIIITTNDKINDSTYIRYVCFDCQCQEKKQYMFITLSNTYKRPWLFNKLNITSINVLHQLDNFIIKLLSEQYIRIANKCQQNNITYNDNEIINNKSIRLNDKEYRFTCFLKNNIIHTKCNNNGLSLLLKKNTHKYANMGLFVIKCRGCIPSVLFEYKDGNILKNTID